MSEMREGNYVVDVCFAYLSRLSLRGFKHRALSANIQLTDTFSLKAVVVVVVFVETEPK